MASIKDFIRSAFPVLLLGVPAIVVGQELVTDFIVASSPAIEVAKASGTSPLEFMSPEIRFGIMTLGMGGLTGWAVGFTMKKFAKLAALCVGIGFMSIQFLAFHKFIIIDWDKIKTAVPNESLQRTWIEAMSILTFNLPFAGSFIAGFWLGFKKG
jgi:uncharacterized membrane protein (Fun14 family)